MSTNPLETARAALRDVETRLDELTAQGDDYRGQLATAEQAENEGRRKRVPVAKLAELMRLTAAARAYVGDVEAEQAALREQLPTLEQTLEREEFLDDLARTADTGTRASAELKSAFRDLAELLRPHVGTIEEMHDRLAAAGEAFAAVRENAGANAPGLVAEAQRRGARLEAVVSGLQPPAGADLPTQLAYKVFGAVAGRYTARKQAVAATAEQARQAAAADRRDQAARDATPVAFAVLERPDEALVNLGSLVLGSQTRPETTRLPAHLEVYTTRGNSGALIDTLKRLKIAFRPLGEPRS